jgi:hypothetical protein
MAKKPRRSECPDKGEASAERAASKTDTDAPMERFKALTRSLLTVSNKQLKEEQLRYEKAKTSRK